MQETQVLSLGQEDLLEKGMATCFSILAWRIPRTEEPGGLRSMGLQRVRHGCSDLACTACTGGASGKEPACQCRRHKRSGFHARVEKIPCRRAWDSLQYSCLENPHGQRSLAATVPRVAESPTWWKRFSRHASMYILCSMCVLDFPGGSEGKRLSTRRETWVWSLGWEDPLGKEMATTPVLLPKKIPWTVELGAGYCPWGCKELGTTTDVIFSCNLFSGYGKDMHKEFTWRCLNIK